MLDSAISRLKKRSGGEVSAEVLGGSDRWASVRGDPEDDREAPRCPLGALCGVQDNHEQGPGVKSMRTICFS